MFLLNISVFGFWGLNFNPKPMCVRARVCMHALKRFEIEGELEDIFV